MSAGSRHSSTADAPLAHADAGLDDGYDAVCDRANLTRRQLLVWAGGRFAAGRPVFSEAALLHLHGRLEVARFVRAWQRVVDESDALRSVITHVDGWPKRDVAPRSASAFDVVDLTRQAMSAAAVEDLARERFERCGQLGGPLVDSLLVRLAPEHHVWVLVQHQLVSDSWSFRLVHQRVDLHYRRDAPLDAEAAEVPSFEGYVAYERTLRGSDRRQAAERHWQRCYGGPSGRVEPPAMVAGRDATRISRLVRRLGRDRSLALRRLGAGVAASDVGVFVACASVVAVHVYRTTGARDVVLAVPFANRPAERFKRTIGSFMNVCPVRVALEGADRFRDLLTRVAAETWEATRHQWYARRPGAVPQPYDLLVNVHRSVVGSHTFADRPMDVVPLVPTHRFGAVLMAIHDFGDTGDLSLVLDFNERAFAAAEREAFVASLLDVIDAALADPDRPVDTVCGRFGRSPDSVASVAGGRACVPEVVDGAVDADLARDIARTWSTLLKIPAVGPTDDFFALGGNSLLAYRMLQAVERVAGVTVSIEGFLADPTVAGLASVVAAETRRGGVDAGAVLREVEGISEEEATRLVADGIAIGSDGGRADD